MTELAVPAAAATRLLPVTPGVETLGVHLSHLGRCPAGGAWLLSEVATAGLRGRGGGWFATWRKWHEVTTSGEPALLAINASEGEPLSAKDRTLLGRRPHLVLDGAVAAAEAIGADIIVIYIARSERRLRAALVAALREREAARLSPIPISIADARHAYVAGESSAVTRRLSGGPAKPEFSIRRGDRRRVDGRAVVVQNAETLAHVALIARYGAAWFRTVGSDGAPGSSLVTLLGAVRTPGVYEVATGDPLSAVLDRAGGIEPDAPTGVLLGGWAGRWYGAAAVSGLIFDPDVNPVGCGIIAVLPPGNCGLREAARVANEMARASARQCGFCINGLRSIAGVMDRIATGRAGPADVHQARRWCTQVTGRGSCHHPDGAAAAVLSALTAFEDDLERHLRGRACVPCTPVTVPQRAWRWRP